MIFNYYHPLDRGYDSAVFNTSKSNPNIEEPILGVRDIGQTITEGRGEGTFIESIQSAIRKGANSVELAMQAEGTEPLVGASLYGKEKRREIREIAKINEINIASVHSPVQVTNLSGFTGDRFSDEYQVQAMNEVKKAMMFAADVAGGGAVVVHVGEFPRPISDAEWNKRKEFLGYEKEEERSAIYFVDEKTGRVISEFRKNVPVYEPEYQTAKDLGLVGKKDPKTGRILQEYDYVDIDGHWIDPKLLITNPEKFYDRLVPKFEVQDGKKKPVIKAHTWDYFENASRLLKQRYGIEIKPEELYFRGIMGRSLAEAKGLASYYSENIDILKKERARLKRALEFYKKIEAKLPEEEKWRIMRERGLVRPDIIPPENVPITEILKEELNKIEGEISRVHELTTAYEMRAKEAEDYIKRVKPMDVYAKERSLDAYAKLGIEAMKLTKERKLPKPIFLAPEQVFPESGYGAHPEELIELVEGARKRMVKLLTDPKSKYYDPRITKEEAEKLAREHIKATLDTEHIGMWKKYFVRKPGESEEEFNKRFNKWYKEQVKKMHEHGIIGHVHIADGFGYGHGNLPAGEGTMPVREAIEYLKTHGYTGAFLSEGYGDPTRILTRAWREFGTPVYGIEPSHYKMRWPDVEHSYFYRIEAPYFVVGPYAPSEDWKLWSKVPFE